AIPGKMCLGHVVENCETASANAKTRKVEIVIDEVFATIFIAPRSYTGEDVVELSGHGGVYVSRRVLESVLSAGARLACPGEFTQRAFLNGRMDLTRAQAVADLIHARSESARRVAMGQLGGRLSDVINGFRQSLIDVCGRLEIELDFIEEDIEVIDKNDLKDELVNVVDQIDKLMDTYERGRVCREGVKLVILGKPNVGKSSLLNALLASERAIVTDTPGTTRDTIEGHVDLEGLLVTITDTAGIRKSPDPIEQEGVRRSEAAARQAGIVVVVVDGSREISSEDRDVIELARSLAVPMLMVLNKSDLPQHRLPDNVADAEMTLLVSALEGTGIEALAQSIKDHALGDGLPGVDDVVVAHLQHLQSLKRTKGAIEQALASISQTMSQEFIALDLRVALDALGEITGETTTDDILHHIFDSFCIGK
ncbi:tRNA uridine-5-carboxymethylaminomethyl(34) synthesis GTPase MnmE, partial [bacterium]|nr:tRNA uridine-5-carboxymethylaminomethyl(34) synthesis GTPase MnmE [bacterium]